MGVYTCIRFVWGLIWRSESSEHPIFTGNPLQAWKKLNKNKFLNKNLNFVLEQQNSSQNQGPSSRNPGKFRSRTLKSDHISLTSLPYFFLKIRAKYDLRIYHIFTESDGWTAVPYRILAFNRICIVTSRNYE